LVVASSPTGALPTEVSQVPPRPAKVLPSPITAPSVGPSAALSARLEPEYEDISEEEDLGEQSEAESVHTEDEELEAFDEVID
jgi:hypothetical protein